MAQKSLLVAAFLVCASAGGLSLLAAGCAPRLGDGCANSTDCSVNPDRTCDIAQPGGYCTIVDCSPGGCGDEGYCVRFKPDEPRLSRNFCMAKCSDTRDCDRDAYVCRSADQLNRGRQERIAEVIDRKKSGKFCVVNEPVVEDEPAGDDAGAASSVSFAGE